jgi:uncharacterized membrane protein
MLDWHTLATIGVLGIVSYALRSGGFLAAGLMQENGAIAKFLRLAPGNLFIAFVAAACVQGGLVTVAGCASAFGVMALCRKEWAALGAGFAIAALLASLPL